MHKTRKSYKQSYKQREAMKEKSRERYKNLSQEKKTRLKSPKEKIPRIGSV